MRPGIDGAFEVGGSGEADDACAAAADVWFHDDGIADFFGCGESLRRVVNDAGFGVRKMEGFEHFELESFGNFVSVGAGAVDDADSVGFEVREVIEGVEDGAGEAALPGGGGPSSG